LGSTAEEEEKSSLDDQQGDREEEEDEPCSLEEAEEEKSFVKESSSLSFVSPFQGVWLVLVVIVLGLVVPFRRSWMAACGGRVVSLGDGECDCRDCRDERYFASPAAAAGPFDCERALVWPKRVLRSRVRDGIVDCCDGSDEGLSLYECEGQALKELERSEERRKEIAEAKKRRQEMTLEVPRLIAEARLEMEKWNPWFQQVIKEFQNPDPRRAAYARGHYEAATRQMHARREAAEGNVGVYGTDLAWLALYGKCFESEPLSDKQVLGGSASLTPASYIFRVCPFDNITQRKVSLSSKDDEDEEDEEDDEFEEEAPTEKKPSDDETLLGIYRAWLAPAMTFANGSVVTKKRRKKQFFGESPNRNAFQTGDARSPRQLQLYDEGAPCVGNRPRHVLLDFTCGAFSRVLSAHEDGLCAYVLELSTPLACDQQPKQITYIKAATYLRLAKIKGTKIAQLLLSFLALDVRQALVDTFGCSLLRFNLLFQDYCATRST